MNINDVSFHGNYDRRRLRKNMHFFIMTPEFISVTQVRDGVVFPPGNSPRKHKHWNFNPGNTARQSCHHTISYQTTQTYNPTSVQFAVLVTNTCSVERRGKPVFLAAIFKVQQPHIYWCTIPAPGDNDCDIKWAYHMLLLLPNRSVWLQNSTRSISVPIYLKTRGDFHQGVGTGMRQEGLPQNGYDVTTCLHLDPTKLPKFISKECTLLRVWHIYCGFPIFMMVKTHFLCLTIIRAGRCCCLKIGFLAVTEVEFVTYFWG